MILPDWLPQYVQKHMAEAIHDRPESANWLQEAGGILLFGTIGSEAYLRPDGTVWYRRATDWLNDEDKFEWHEGHGNERWAALVLGSRSMPELRALLPVRPLGTPDCVRCKGQGEILLNGQPTGKDDGIICPTCGALGWVFSGAA
jgi:hypothetical protein